MKKLLSLVLVLAMLLSFAACGEDKSAKDDDNNNNNKPVSSSASSKEEEKPIVLAEGRMEDGVYINESIGIKIAPNEDWPKVIPGAELVIFNGEDAAFETTKHNIWTDCSAVSEKSDVVMIHFEKTDKNAEEYLQDGKTEFLDDDDGSIESCEIIQTKIAGITMDCIKIKKTVKGNVITTFAAVKKCENAMLVIHATLKSTTVDEALSIITKA